MTIFPQINSFDGVYRFLSNFHPCVVYYEDLKFTSVESAYQSAKCKHIKDRIRFVKLTAPQAKQLGKKIDIRDDWGYIKVDVMRDLIEQKFSVGGKLSEWLLDTGDAILVEGNTWNDTFWGVCNGKGQNVLGNLLMERREILRGRDDR